MIVNGIVTAVLAVESVADIRTKSISLFRLIEYFVAGVVANLVFKYQSFISVVGGIFVGVIVLIYGLITHEGIGYGDGILFVCLGVVLGTSENLCLLFFSLLTVTVVGGIAAVVGHKGIKFQIPFIPCILATFIVMNILEAVI